MSEGTQRLCTLIFNFIREPTLSDVPIGRLIWAGFDLCQVKTYRVTTDVDEDGLTSSR